MNPPRWTRVLGSLAFPEGLRWRDDSLYFSDVFGRTVHRTNSSGPMEQLGAVASRPSGLGFGRDGHLLAVAMGVRAVVDLDRGGAVVADLAPFVDADCNDMLVDPVGRAYVGNLGYDFVGGGTPRPADLVRADPDGTIHTVARELWFPNGMALVDDDRTLVVAETSAERLTAFTVDPDGGLRDRRVHAAPGEFRPDGIAADAEGGIWSASPRTESVVRVDAAGRVTERLPAPPDGMPHACALGGADGRTLFVACSPTHDEATALEHRDGAIVSTQVTVASKL